MGQNCQDLSELSELSEFIAKKITGTKKLQGLMPSGLVLKLLLNDSENQSEIS